MIFQITGYPRSGTAWLTTMFNLAPEVMAYHELAMTDSNWKTRLETTSVFQPVGDIGTYQYFPKAVINNSRKIFINQDPWIAQTRVQTAVGSFLKNETHLRWKRIAENWASEWEPMIVQFENLFNILTLEKIWIYCIGDIEHLDFPKEKVEQLLKFNIQLHEPAKALSEPGAIERLAELL